MVTNSVHSVKLKVRVLPPSFNNKTYLKNFVAEQVDVVI